jgi:hypothetical protein
MALIAAIRLLILAKTAMMGTLLPMMAAARFVLTKALLWADLYAAMEIWATVKIAMTATRPGETAAAQNACMKDQ